MHCPSCGSMIENEQTNFCTRCGQQLDQVRAALKGEIVALRPVETSRAGINLGVGLMYAGMWPALIAVMSSPIAIPAALLMLIAAFAAILLGSGPLLRIFQAGDVPKEIERTRKREIAFGSTLMFGGVIIATMLVAIVVPDRFVPIGLVTAINAVFALLLASSKSLFQGFRELTSGERSQLAAAPRSTLSTGPIRHAVELEAAETRSFENALPPPSIIDSTTRNLDDEKACSTR